MKFYDYPNARNRWGVRFPSFRGTPEMFRLMATQEVLRRSRGADYERDVESAKDATCFAACRLEEMWVKENRPFYNVWPPVLEMIEKVDLRGVKVAHIKWPVSPLLLKFPDGNEFQWLLAAQDESSGHSILVLAYTSTWEAVLPVRNDEHLEQLLSFVNQAEITDNGMKISHATVNYAEWCVRVVVLASLLADDPRIIQPVVLAKDRHEYMVTKDEERKKLLELRSIRKQGMGFEIGREWHETRDTSPHFRNAHLCLFWTGKERSQPVIKLRKGCMVQPRKMLEIPTGYMGPEDEEELVSV